MDQKLFFLINHDWTSPALDLLMATLSSFDFWIPLLALLVVSIAIFGGFKARALLVVSALLLAIFGGLMVDGLKRVVNRPRPTQVQPPVRVVDLQKARPRLLAILRPPVVRASHPEETAALPGHSFPSGHTVNNFLLLAALVSFYGWRGALFAPFALGVAYSRVYTGSHWPSDVLASIFIGGGLGLFGTALAERLWKRFGARVAPRLHGLHPSLLNISPNPEICA